MNNAKLRFAIGLIAALVSLAGCAGKVRYPNYYVLSLPTPAGAAMQSAPAFGPAAVREFSAPGFLTDGPIVYRQSLAQLGFYNYHRWAEDPRRAVTGAIVRELRARGIFQSVDLLDGRGSPAYLITGTLDHLEEVDDGPSVS